MESPIKLHSSKFSIPWFFLPLCSPIRCEIPSFLVKVSSSCIKSVLIFFLFSLYYYFFFTLLRSCKISFLFNSVAKNEEKLRWEWKIYSPSRSDVRERNSRWKQKPTSIDARHHSQVDRWSVKISFDSKGIRQRKWKKFKFKIIIFESSIFLKKLNKNFAVKKVKKTFFKGFLIKKFKSKRILMKTCD